jgi:diaminopimelate epimerase
VIGGGRLGTSPDVADRRVRRGDTLGACAGAHVRFDKYQALGNDYLVLVEPGLEAAAEAAWARAVCDRHFGVGADGLLLQRVDRPFALRILNPDGSEAEKSGNGLRIFARWLFDAGRVGHEPFQLETAGGRVGCRVGAGAREIEVDMGRVSFRSEDIPVLGTQREVLREPLELEGERLVFSAATLGNPHCVVERDPVLEEDCLRLGPRLERHSLFPHRTNVQLLRVLDRQNLHIEIWERGAGRTLASGSSSCAAAAVARRLRLCEASVHVRMAGGVLDVHVAEDFSVRLTGPASPVLDGRLGDALLPQRWRDA